MRTQIIDKTVVVSSVEGNVQILLADGSSRPPAWRDTAAWRQTQYR